jgi:hypothetical protein
MVPTHFRVGTGIVYDRFGNDSGQTDLVIEHPFGFRFPVGAGNNSLYLAENVGCILEAKSNFDKQFSEIKKKIHEVLALKKVVIKFEDARIVSHIPEIIPVFIVAFKGPTSMEILVRKLSKIGSEKFGFARWFFGGILIIESGLYWGVGPTGGRLEATTKAASIFSFMRHVSEWLHFNNQSIWDLRGY